MAKIVVDPYAWIEHFRQASTGPASQVLRSRRGVPERPLSEVLGGEDPGPRRIAPGFI